MIQFIPTREQDLEAVLTLYNYYIATSTATFSIEPLEMDEMKRIMFSGIVRYPSFCIYEDQVFLGYVLLNRYKPREAYDQTAEVTIYLAPEAIGKGIGKQALTFIEGFAKDNAFRALLAVVCAENEESIRLFKKFDYFQCGHFREVGKKFNRILDIYVYEKLI